VSAADSESGAFRIFYITTNGYVRGGVLDELLELSDKVLSGEITNLRFLPLIYEIDEEEERDDPAMWIKANPSLPYFRHSSFRWSRSMNWRSTSRPWPASS